MVLFKERFMKLDFFGAQFQFSVMGNKRFKSISGLIMSILCLFVIVLTSILFGKDFYNKENPRVVIENIKTDDFKEINFTPDLFTFAFRIENGAGNYAEQASTYLKLNFGYKRYVYNETEQDFDNEGYRLPITPCNNTIAPDSKFSKGRNLSEWLCLDFPKDGFKFGKLLGRKICKLF